MASIWKCPKCGLDLTLAGAATCPGCGAAIVTPPRLNVWVVALVQIAVSTAFMLIFGFPRIMIVIFGALILATTAFSSRFKGRPATVSPKPVSHPALFRVLSIGIALGSFAFVAILLFGFVIFMNAWTRWHQYEGPYSESDFQVTRVYYQVHTRGSPEVFASGTVDGKKEWMNLVPYLHRTPHNQAELDALVPAGTSIPVYLFPELKGRARVQVFQETPPAESNRRSAMAAINYGLAGLGLSAGIIFVLVRLRRSCFENTDGALQTT